MNRNVVAVAARTTDGSARLARLLAMKMRRFMRRGL
jgi:hypothetical protein